MGASERRETLQREKELRLQERRSIFICIGACGGFTVAFDSRCVECGGKYKRYAVQAVEVEVEVEDDAASRRHRTKGLNRRSPPMKWTAG
jgi:hypothetical protein